MYSSSTTLRKIGNSQGIILDKSICDSLGMQVGETVNFTVDENCIVIRPERAKKPLIGIAKGRRLVSDGFFDEDFDSEIAGMMGALP